MKVRATDRGFYGQLREAGEVFILEDPKLFSKNWMESLEPSETSGDDGTEIWANAVFDVTYEVTEDDFTPEMEYTPPPGLTSDNVTSEHVLQFAEIYVPYAEQDELTAKGYLKKKTIEKHMGVEISPRIFSFYTQQANVLVSDQSKAGATQ